MQSPFENLSPPMRQPYAEYPTTNAGHPQRHESGENSVDAHDVLFSDDNLILDHFELHEPLPFAAQETLQFPLYSDNTTAQINTYPTQIHEDWHFAESRTYPNISPNGLDNHFPQSFSYLPDHPTSKYENVGNTEPLIFQTAASHQPFPRPLVTQTFHFQHWTSETVQSPDDTSWSLNTPPSLGDESSLASGTWDSFPGEFNLPLGLRRSRSRSRSRRSGSSFGSANHHHSISNSNGNGLHGSFDLTHSVNDAISSSGDLFSNLETQEVPLYPSTIPEDDELLFQVDLSTYPGAVSVNWNPVPFIPESIRPPNTFAYSSFAEIRPDDTQYTPQSDNAVASVEEQHGIVNGSNFLHEVSHESREEGEEEEEEVSTTDNPASWNCFVMEDGKGGMTRHELPNCKGKRNGPLQAEKRLKVAKNRKAGSTCLRCKIGRQGCDGGNPCGRCIGLAKSMVLASPCMRAAFLPIVESGSCNYISQRAINHFTTDEKRRIQMFLPKTFNMDQLLSLLKSRRGSFNIRARQASGSLYVLDLAKCHEFLSDIKAKSETNEKDKDLRSFIDDTLTKKNQRWFKCVRECDPGKNKTLLLSQWNNMPSRASYSLVPISEDSSTSSDAERPLDPESPTDKEEILLAAQLSRIICRKLEIDGYRALQTKINAILSSSTNSTSSGDNNDPASFVSEFGKILLSLRWRMSWWELLGSGSSDPDPFRDKFVERVRGLMRILYFLYFEAKRNVPSFTYYNESEHRQLGGVWSSYPDSESVWDDFPTIESVAGFEEWVERGKTVIKQSNARGVVKK